MTEACSEEAADQQTQLPELIKTAGAVLPSEDPHISSNRGLCQCLSPLVGSTAVHNRELLYWSLVECHGWLDVLR